MVRYGVGGTPVVAATSVGMGDEEEEDEDELWTALTEVIQRRPTAPEDGWGRRHRRRWVNLLSCWT